MKKKRQDTILALIAAEDIPTQEVLRERMAEQGFAVTQATLSRDIRELKLTKERRSGGRACFPVSAAGRTVRCSMPIVSRGNAVIWLLQLVVKSTTS